MAESLKLKRPTSEFFTTIGVRFESGSNSLILLDKPVDFKFSTAVVLVHPKGNDNAKRRRRRNQVSSDDKLALSKFLKNANEDILLEIFLRLPNCRFATLFGSVCRRWHALISQPQFIPSFIRLHQDQSSYMTILFRRNYHHHYGHPDYYQPVCKLFSNESLLLHGNHANYFDFMPSPMIIRASFRDLLLVSPNYRSNRRTLMLVSPNYSGPKYYICNPVTKRWFLVPGEVPYGTRIGFALICSDNELVFSTNAQYQYQYKVVLIHFRELPVQEEVVHCRTKVTVFCSKSGQWTQSYLSYPLRTKKDYTFDAKVVTCNGILYWMDSLEYHYRILALDLFSTHCGVIYFPADFDNISIVKVHLGVVRGDQLRLLQICRAGASGTCFLMKVWELNYRDNSWVFVHERILNRPNADEKIVSVAFHPNNSDVVFMIWGIGVFEYRISKDVCQKVGELQESIGDEGLESFTLVHPAWPTSVPSHLPSI